MDKKFSGFLPYDFFKFVLKAFIGYIRLLKLFIFNRSQIISTFRKSGLTYFLLNNYKLDKKYWINIILFFLSIIEQLISIIRFFFAELLVFGLFYIIYVYGFFVHMSNRLSFNIVCDFWVINYDSTVFYLIVIPGYFLDYIGDFYQFFFYDYFFPVWNILSSFDVEWLLALLVLFIFSLVREALSESISLSSDSFESFNNSAQLQSNKNTLSGLITINKTFITFWFSFFSLNNFYALCLRTRSSYATFTTRFLTKQYSFQTTIFNAISLNFSSYLMSSTLNSIFFNNLIFFNRANSTNAVNLVFLLKNLKRNVFSHWFVGLSN